MKRSKKVTTFFCENERLPEAFLCENVAQKLTYFAKTGDFVSFGAAQRVSGGTLKVGDGTPTIGAGTPLHL